MKKTFSIVLIPMAIMMFAFGIKAIFDAEYIMSIALNIGTFVLLFASYIINGYLSQK